MRFATGSKPIEHLSRLTRVVAVLDRLEPNSQESTTIGKWFQRMKTQISFWVLSSLMRRVSQQLAVRLLKDLGFYPQESPAEIPKLIQKLSKTLIVIIGRLKFQKFSMTVDWDSTSCAFICHPD